VNNPTQDLDEIVHQRTRLGILAVLAEGSRVQFGYFLDELGLTDGNLSRHLTTLQSAGYVTIDKARQGARTRTWVRITPRGRRALDTEIALLKQLVREVEKASPASPRRRPAHARPAARASRASGPVAAD
jgi:DNA-binding MarR family transcriptional regulator